MQQFGQTREGRRVRGSRGAASAAAAAAALGQAEVVQLMWMWMRMQMLLGRRCLRVCCGTFLARTQAARIAAWGGRLRGGDSVVRM